MTGVKPIWLGTRGSELARWQTDYVLNLLKTAWPNLIAEVEVISTHGDRVLDTPLPLVGGKGLFTAELETALRSGEIDLAVHSLKDLPTESPEGLTVGAIPIRTNPTDVLVSRNNHTLETLPTRATVGTSSHRRAAQLLHLRPDIQVIDIRGNVDTRVRKALDPNGSYDAILLAYAGLERLGRLDMVSEVLGFENMLPAPGQGALAVQCRRETASLDLLAPIHNGQTAVAVTAERAFLAGLGGGCTVPVGAYASADDSGVFRLRGRVTSMDGRQQIDVSAILEEASMEAAVRAGTELAQQALQQGANVLLEAAQ
ncbi:MAG: hydroxymethylbilane synthase [Chloroflexi bacterium]|nr:hydroxymethylbilane synthase [Chloroflexota bacterium]